MKTYDKQKLNEYAKELFALCLEKDITFQYFQDEDQILIRNTWIEAETYIGKFDYKLFPIWELIEKVKAL